MAMLTDKFLFKFSSTIADLKSKKKWFEQEQKDKQEFIAEIERLNKNLERYDEATFWSKTILDKIYSHKLPDIVEILDSGMKQIFPGSNYGIEIELSDTYSKSAVLNIIKQDGHKLDLRMSNGEGVVCALCLLYILINCKLHGLNIVFLDEKLVNICEEYVDTLFDFTTSLAKDFGITIVMIAHDKRFFSKFERLYRIERHN